MVYLYRFLKFTTKQAKFKFHPNCKKPCPTHLIFVDDLILLKIIDNKLVPILMEAFNKFSATFRLLENKNKC